jgi:hypothetical protein
MTAVFKLLLLPHTASDHGQTGHRHSHQGDGGSAIGYRYRKALGIVTEGGAVIIPKPPANIIPSLEKLIVVTQLEEKLYRLAALTMHRANERKGCRNPFPFTVFRQLLFPPRPRVGHKPCQLFHVRSLPFLPATSIADIGGAESKKMASEQQKRRKVLPCAQDQ